MVTFLVTRFPSSSVNCSSVTDSPGMFLASSPCGESLGVKVWVGEVSGEDEGGKGAVWVICTVVHQHFQTDRQPTGLLNPHKSPL